MDRHRLRMLITTVIAAAVGVLAVRAARGRRARRLRAHRNDTGLDSIRAEPMVEEWGHESFPASDPPQSW